MHVGKDGWAIVESEAQSFGTAIGATYEDLALKANTRNMALAPRNRGRLDDVFTLHSAPIGVYSIWIPPSPNRFEIPGRRLVTNCG